MHELANALLQPGASARVLWPASQQTSLLKLFAPGWYRFLDINRYG
jgi:hypothetical protein